VLFKEDPKRKTPPPPQRSKSRTAPRANDRRSRLKAGWASQQLRGHGASALRNGFLIIRRSRCKCAMKKIRLASLASVTLEGNHARIYAELPHASRRGLDIDPDTCGEMRPNKDEGRGLPHELAEMVARPSVATPIMHILEST